jgi:hypothetical protein
MVLLASFGALAQFLSHKERHAVQFAIVLSGCAVAAFAGVMVHFIAQYLQLDQNLSYLIAGIAGWVGPQAIEWITTHLLNKFGVERRISVHAAELAAAPESTVSTKDALTKSKKSL